MKLLALVLAVSAAANAALIAAFVAKPSLAPLSVRGYFETGDTSSPRPSDPRPPGSKTHCGRDTLMVATPKRRLAGVGRPTARGRVSADARARDRRC